MAAAPVPPAAAPPPPAGGGGGGPPAAPALPESLQYRLGKPVDPEAEREKVRKYLALTLVALLFIVAVLLIAMTAINDLSVSEAKELAAFVLSPVVAVTGTALGFYFGAQRGGR
jgi:hypothetical protein